MNHDPLLTRRLTGALLTTGLVLGLAACGSKPKPVDLNAKAEIQKTEGGVRMPAGADYGRIVAAEKGAKTIIYTQLMGMGDANNEKLLFPPAVAKSIGVTPLQVQTRFMDTIGVTKRYDVRNVDRSVTADQSDYLVEAMFVGTTQELRRIEGGVRVAVTQVRLRANLVNRYTGAPVWDAPIVVVGETGGSTGDRVTLAPNENEGMSAVQQRLGLDYQRAMQRAFDKLAVRLDLSLRPMGKVTSVDEDNLSVIGGQRNGLQGGDEMVVFRAKLVRIGKFDELSDIRAVAAVRCDGVGSATSQCDVIRKDPRYKPEPGDFAILTDHSARGTRMVD